MEINLKDRTITLHSSDFLTVKGAGPHRDETVHVVRIAMPCSNCGAKVSWNLLLSNQAQPITWLDTSQRNSRAPTILDLKANIQSSHE